MLPEKRNTLVYLHICRFYDTEAGSVLLGGYDVRKLTLASLRGALGKVPQDMVLFNGEGFFALCVFCVCIVCVLYACVCRRGGGGEGAGGAGQGTPGPGAVQR